MCVSVTVMVATLVLLEGVGGGSSQRTDDTSRPTPRSCLQQCLERYYVTGMMETQPRISSSCCDFTTFKCFTHCKMQQKDGFPGWTSLGEDVSKGASSTSLEVVVNAWRNAVARCRSCRRKRRSTSPLVREAALVARSVGLDLETGAESRARFVKVHDVRVVSQSRREDTVSALVTWEPASSSASGHLYLVSWQAHGDALRGNLLTNTPSTTLSLLPDTVYDLQISAAGADSPSGYLVVDTHSPTPPAYFTHTLPLTEESAGAAAALSALLVLALLLALRWRYTRNLGLKVGAGLRDCDDFKVFPPPVTLFVVPPPPYESPSHPHHPSLPLSVE